MTRLIKMIIRFIDRLPFIVSGMLIGTVISVLMLAPIVIIDSLWVILEWVLVAIGVMLLERYWDSLAKWSRRDD